MHVTTKDFDWEKLKKWMDNFIQFLNLKPNLYSTVVFARQQQHCWDFHSSIFKKWRLRRRQARKKKKLKWMAAAVSDKHGRWLKQKFVTLFSYSQTHTTTAVTLEDSLIGQHCFALKLALIAVVWTVSCLPESFLCALQQVVMRDKSYGLWQGLVLTVNVPTYHPYICHHDESNATLDLWHGH